MRQGLEKTSVGVDPQKEVPQGTLPIYPLPTCLHRRTGLGLSALNMGLGSLEHLYSIKGRSYLSRVFRSNYERVWQITYFTSMFMPETPGSVTIHSEIGNAFRWVSSYPSDRIDSALISAVSHSVTCPCRRRRGCDGDRPSRPVPEGAGWPV